MNRNQKIISLVSLGFLIVMCLFPPWKITSENGDVYIEQPVGYSLIFSPPSIEQDDESEMSGYSISLDIERLVVQWVTLLFTVAVMLFVTKENEEVTDEETEFF